MIIILRLEWTITMNNITYSQMNIAQAIFLRKRNMYKLMNENNKITCVKHVYNEQCQYSNNTNSPSGHWHCHVLEPFDCSYMYQNPLRGTRLSKNYPYFCRLSIEDRSRDIGISSPFLPAKSFLRVLLPWPMTATMTLTMCFDEQITQGKVHDYFETSKVYFTMPNIIFRTRTMSCELASLLCRPLLNVSLTRHTKEKCRIDQQYIFHWWSVKIFNCLSFRRQLKKINFTPAWLLR
jgi:hypothetical protein